MNRLRNRYTNTFPKFLYMATIVTAFVTNINRVETRPYEKYIELGKKLLHQAIPTVCFMERHVYDDYFADQTHHYPLTTFRMFERSDNYLYEHEHELTDFWLDTDNPTKDTPGYMFVQCHKTEWVKMAIEENPYHTEQFIWIDFGIYHMIQNEMDFAVSLNNLVRKHYDGIRIASCVDLNTPCTHLDLFRQVSWYFAGSIFGGSKADLLVFADRMKSFTVSLMKQKKHIMWEINLWYLLYQLDKSSFLPYHCNHDLSILEHY